ncbi:hypothetical protein PsorP6_010689 [Peronosclerospora sorghi]|uniref:Uncharacterized protein n=1 Tax=Peronosclerospora sorghi TaxID=230839 RepID=A0ACC0VU69_9STRA|nr:hypothetical protein PsorP6_010689 [Peronosclerospora sorghi]
MFYPKIEATEDEDEVLVALAEELGGFVDLVGGAEYASTLVEPLEVLAGVEETVVRYRAVDYLQKVVAVVPNVGDVMVPLVRSLAEGDWFMSRVSFYIDLWQAFGSWTQEGAERDSVRLLDIENSTAIAEFLSPEDNALHVLPIDFYPLSRATGQPITESELLSFFSNLPHDAEAEVRAAAAKNLSGYVLIIKSELFSSELLLLLSALSQDTAPNVRTAVSIACMELAPKLGEVTSKSILYPLLLLFLRDEVVDVRLKILKRMEFLAQWMDSFESVLLPAVADLARDLQWRVREAVVLSIPALAGSLGAQYFQEHLLEIYVSAFTDMVGEVRLSATKISPQLLDALESDYILQNVMPSLNQIFEKSIIYQERANALHALKQMAVEKVSSDLLSLITTLAIRGAHDKIPNVRFVASMTLEQLCKIVDASVVATQVRYVMQLRCAL